MIKFYGKIFKTNLEKSEESTIERFQDHGDWETESSIDWSTYDSEP